MAIYRSDQAQLTFGVEAAQGGHPELASAVTDGTGSAVINNSAGYAAGTRTLTVDALSGITAGEFIQIGPEVSGSGTTRASEVRKVEYVDGTTGLTLDAPTAFFHPDNTNIQVVTGVTDTDGNKYIDLIPGVYETVDLPDMAPSIEPRYFLGTASKRNFFAAYSGQQTYTGSIGGFVLLNGKALRFPIGQVATSTAFVNTAGSSNDPSYGAMINGAVKKGDVHVTVDAAFGSIVQNSYIVFTGSTTQATESSSTSEVRQHIGADSTTALLLDYPLQFDHADDEFVYLVMTTDGGTTVATPSNTVATFTHAITEKTDLDSVTWHAHMRASDEDADKDFDRRYYGGKIGSASISAEEGGLVTMSWDGVQFLGMITNQQYNTGFSSSTNHPFYSLMQKIDSDDVNFPTTDPYYFSQGEVSMFGQTIARLRNFTLSISNGEEARYYIQKQMGRRKGPVETKENRREYSMSATIALPDALTSASTAARTLFTEMLLEGDYGSGKAGFNITLTFTRGTNDTITITIPDDGSAGTGGNNQGAFIRSAQHDFGGDNPFQVDADILFRNMKIDVVDSEHYYP
tara:strand:- start:330 stop:2048 length:1719 start_codon:yes stop_codon:yes gene_type:complete